MRFLSWNIRGLGNKERINQLRGYISHEKIDIIGVQETIKQDFSNKELRSLDGDNNFFWKWLPARALWWHSDGSQG
jgi:exonuclease III